MRTESEYRALLLLLGDEQERVTVAAREALKNDPAEATPYLEEAARGPDPVVRGRARLLLADLGQERLESEWREFAQQPDDLLDLETGCLLLARVHGDVQPKSTAGFLDAVTGMVRAHMVSVGAMHALHEVMFDNLGFRGGDFSDPNCHFLPRVLERRKGIPIALATVYVLVARRLGLPVSGVAMPGHYLARWERVDGPAFIDCYDRGRQYRKESLTDLLAGKGLRFAESALTPSTTRFTLFRMLNNLEQLYRDAEDSRMVTAVQRLRACLRP